MKMWRWFDERQDGFAGHAVTLHESFEKGHGRLRAVWLRR